MPIRILLLILFVCHLSTSGAFGQSKKTPTYKNSISLYYAADLTQTNLDRKKVGSSGWFRTLAEIEPHTNPVYGYNAGIEYKRSISKKMQIVFGIGYEEKGEISNKIAIHNSGNPNSENVLVQYKYRLQSFQMMLGLTHIGHEIKILKKKCRTIYGINVIMDVYGKFTAQDYLNFKDTGKRRKGGITEWLLYSSSWTYDVINHTKEGYVRIGIGANYGIRYPICKRVYCRVSGQFNYYTSPIEKHTFLIPGSAMLFGITVAPGFYF